MGRTGAPSLIVWTQKRYFEQRYAKAHCSVDSSGHRASSLHTPTKLTANITFTSTSTGSLDLVDQRLRLLFLRNRFSRPFLPIVSPEDTNTSSFGNFGSFSEYETTVTSKIQILLRQGCISARRYVAVSTKFCTVATNTRAADKSLARPWRKQATATEDFECHISYL